MEDWIMICFDFVTTSFEKLLANFSALPIIIVVFEVILASLANEGSCRVPMTP